MEVVELWANKSDEMRKIVCGFNDCVFGGVVERPNYSDVVKSKVNVPTAFT